jgi:hypothetical protein
MAPNVRSSTLFAAAHPYGSIVTSAAAGSPRFFGKTGGQFTIEVRSTWINKMR